MKNTMIRSLSLFGISVMMALSVAAQDEPKVKTSDKENKYKSEDLKIKEKKDEDKYKTDDHKIKDKKDETKYKTDDGKVKVKKDETKVKSEDLKIKEDKDERKVKAKVKPMQTTETDQTELKKGETRVRTKEHIEPIPVQPTAPAASVSDQTATPGVSTDVKIPAARKQIVHKTTRPKTASARQPGTKPKYIVRTKVVRDTVVVRETVAVPSLPEKEAATQTEYVHDTVFVTRVDTVMKTQTENTYNGYNVPRGDFKKVKLKKDKDGEVQMKRK